MSSLIPDRYKYVLLTPGCSPALWKVCVVLLYHCHLHHRSPQPCCFHVPGCWLVFPGGFSCRSENSLLMIVWSWFQMWPSVWGNYVRVSRGSFWATRCVLAGVVGTFDILSGPLFLYWSQLFGCRLGYMSCFPEVLHVEAGRQWSVGSKSSHCWWVEVQDSWTYIWHRCFRSGWRSVCLTN